MHSDHHRWSGKVQDQRRRSFGQVHRAPLRQSSTPTNLVRQLFGNVDGISGADVVDGVKLVRKLILEESYCDFPFE